MLFNKYINTLRINHCCKTAIKISDELDNISTLLDRLLVVNQTGENRLDMLATTNSRLEELVKIAKREKCLHG